MFKTSGQFISVTLVLFLYTFPILAAFREAPSVPKRPSRLVGCGLILSLQFSQLKVHKSAIASHQKAKEAYAQWTNEKFVYDQHLQQAQRHLEHRLQESQRKEPEGEFADLEGLQALFWQKLIDTTDTNEIGKVLTDYNREFDTHFTLIKQKAEQMRQEIAWKKALSKLMRKLDNRIKFYSRQEPNSNILQMGTDALVKLAESKDEAAASAIISKFEESAPVEVARARAERKSREKRHDIELNYNSRDVLRDFIDERTKLLGEKAQLSFESVVRIMDQSMPFKKFIYREMQFIRLASRSLTESKESEKVRSAAIARLNQNDLLIESAITSGSSNSVKQALALRSMILKINSPQLFAGVLLPEGRLERRLDLEEREKLLSLALSHEEVAGLIILVASRLQAPPEQPTPPKAPARNAPDAPKPPPSLSSYDKRSRSKVEAYNRSVREYRQSFSDYQEAYKKWRKKWEAYKAEFSKFQIEIEKYKSEVEAYKDLAVRYHAARQSLLLLLVKTFPTISLQKTSSFNKVAQDQIATAKRKTSPATQSAIKERITQRQEATDRSSSTDSASTIDDGWFWYFYLYNPWWMESHGFERHYLSPALDAHPKDEPILKSAFDPSGVLHGQAPSHPVENSTPATTELKSILFETPELFILPTIIETNVPGEIHTPSAHPLFEMNLPEADPKWSLPEIPTVPEIPEIPKAAVEAPAVEMSMPEPVTTYESPSYNDSSSGYDSGGGYDSGSSGGDSGGGGGD